MTHPLHFFISAPENIVQVGNVVTLDKADSHHVWHVLRISADTEITIADNKSGQLAKARICGVNQGLVQATIIELLEQSSNQSIVKTLICGLCKIKTCEELIERAAELGVTEVVFFRAAHSQYSNEQFKKITTKLGRWSSIAESACKQAKMSKITKIAIYDSLQATLDNLRSDQQSSFILSLETQTLSIAEIKKTVDNCILAVGPEGDFSHTEYALFSKHGFTPIRLNAPVLKSASAAVYGIIALQVIQILNA